MIKFEDFSSRLNPPAACLNFMSFFLVMSGVIFCCQENPWSFVFSGRGIDTWVFPKIGVPQNGWFIMENLIKMDDLGVHLFLETPTYHCKDEKPDGTHPATQVAKVLQRYRAPNCEREVSRHGV